MKEAAEEVRGTAATAETSAGKVASVATQAAEVNLTHEAMVDTAFETAVLEGWAATKAEQAAVATKGIAASV